MANSLSSDMVVDIAAERAITVLQDKLAPLNAFATNFSDDPAVASANGTLQPIKVELASEAATVLTNPSNFESGDTTTSAISVQPTYYSRPFHVSSTELNQGHQIERLFDINLHKLANAIIDVAMGPVTTTNFGAASVSTSASFTTTGQQTLWAAIEQQERKSLILAGAVYAAFLPTSLENIRRETLESGGYGGWDGGIYHCGRFDGAVANLKALAIGPNAIAAVARQPEIPESVQSLLISNSTVTIPGLNLTVSINRWGSLSSRADWMSFDVVFGASVGDTTSGVAALGIWS
jgi:hypothetical protein